MSQISPVLPGLLAPPEIVEPPQVTPAPHSLLATAIEVTEPVQQRMGQDVEPWTGGFVFQPKDCDQGGVWVPCIDSKPDDLNPNGSGSGSGEQLKSRFDSPDEIVFVPYWVEAQWTCQTRDPEIGRWPQRAQENLVRVQTKQVELETWTGRQMANHPTGQNNQSFVKDAFSVLNPGGASSPTPVSPRKALALLQQGLAICGTGSRGMIHGTAYLIEWLANENRFTNEGTRLSTWTRGTWVVSGAGYPGTGPLITPEEYRTPGQGALTNNMQWMYATGIANYRLGSIKTYPSDEASERAIGQAMEPRPSPGVAHGFNNEVSFQAERAAAVVWDPCCTLAVLVDVCATDC